MGVMASNDQLRAPAVRRAARVLREVALEPAGISMSELSRRLDAPKSSLGDLCGVLAETGLVRRGIDGSLQLGPKVEEFAGGFIGNSALLRVFDAECARFAAVDEHVVLLATLVGSDSVYLAVRGNGRPQPLSLRVGMRLPAWATSTGISLLTALSDEEVETLHAHNPPLLPSGEPPRLSDVLTQVAHAREAGVAIDEGLGDAALSGSACLVPTASTTRPVAVGLISPATPHTYARDARLVRSLASHLAGAA